MGRKKKKEIQIPPAVIKIGVMFVYGCALVIGGISIFKMIYNSPYFKVETVVIDPSLKFINDQSVTKKDLISLVGKNIFEIDIADVQRNLSQKYPAVSDLRVERQFPDQLLITARKRLPIAQIYINKKYYVLDEIGVVMSEDTHDSNKWPVIVNVKLDSSDVDMGKQVDVPQVQDALKIINYFERDQFMSAFKITAVDVTQLSEILVQLKESVMVKFDTMNLDRQLNNLNLVLSKGQVDLGTVKYIDVRFDKPSLGMK